LGVLGWLGTGLEDEDWDKDGSGDLSPLTQMDKTPKGQANSGGMSSSEDTPMCKEGMCWCYGSITSTTSLTDKAHLSVDSDETQDYRTSSLSPLLPDVSLSLTLINSSLVAMRISITVNDVMNIPSTQVLMSDICTHYPRLGAPFW